MHINANGFCKSLTPKQLEDLSNNSHAASLKRGEAIDGHHLLAWPIVAISSGVISMQHLLEDGRKTIAALFMQGDIIDMRGISSRNRSHLIALNKSNICRLSPDVFESIVETNREAQHIVWNNLRSQTHRAIDHSADLAKKQALEKLASFIFECRHRGTKTNKTKENVLVDIPVRRIDLAEYLGMQPETVSRSFRTLEERGIIEMQTISTVLIKQAPVLRRIANGDKTTEKMRRVDDDRFKVLSFG